MKIFSSISFLVLSIILVGSIDARKSIRRQIMKETAIKNEGISEFDDNIFNKKMLEKNIEIDDFQDILLKEDNVLPSRCSTDVKNGPSYYRAMLGKATWRLLHTMAANYPHEPSSLHQVRTLEFLILLSQLYPCEMCSAHFQELLTVHPPALSSREEFSAWMCFFHNTVNEKLGKPIFECHSNVDAEYDCGCDSLNEDGECPFLK